MIVRISSRLSFIEVEEERSCFFYQCVLKCIDYKPPGYKTFSCSTQLSMKFFLLINVKMPTIVGILTFMSVKNSILGLSEPKKTIFLMFLYL